MEVKFKNGDSVEIPEGCKAVVKDDVVIFEPIEQKFKKGDFLATDDGDVLLIFKEYQSENSMISYFNKSVLGFNQRWNKSAFRLATPEEKAELIEYMRENGKDLDEAKCEVVDYRWRAENWENYFVVSYKDISQFLESGHQIDNSFYNSGNYFKTKELAEIALQKINELFLTLKHS